MFSDASGVEDWGDLRGVSSGKSDRLVLLKTWNIMDIKVDGQKSDRVKPIIMANFLFDDNYWRITCIIFTLWCLPLSKEGQLACSWHFSLGIIALMWCILKSSSVRLSYIHSKLSKIFYFSCFRWHGMLKERTFWYQHTGWMALWVIDEEIGWQQMTGNFEFAGRQVYVWQARGTSREKLSILGIVETSNGW